MYTALIVFFLIAITVSFLCSLWEAVLLSITPAYAQIKLQEGTSIGTKLQAFKQDVDRPLVAILTLNTIAHTVGAIGVGEQAGKIWADANPLITGLIVPAVMTLGILVLSEIIPKTVGATYWKEFAGFTVNSLSIVILVLLPLVWMSQLLTGLIKREGAKSVFSRSDFLAMAEIGANEGVIEAEESEIIRNLLRFNEVTAKDVMTPRSVIKMASEDMSAREFFEANQQLRFSRIPLHKQGDKDHITGYFLKHDLLAHLVGEEGSDPLSVLERKIMIIQPNHPIPDLFRMFMERREHVSVVVGEYGSVIGLVTMEDVIETLLGMEIVDELDSAHDMQAMARKAWERRARDMGLIESPANAAAVEEVGEGALMHPVAESSAEQSDDAPAGNEPPTAS